MPLIVFEGIDGSGKTVQFKLLGNALATRGIDYLELDFPRYDKGSSILVKEYLGGKYGSDPNDISPYAASSFYAVDRVASYYEGWKADADRDRLIISNRYSTSNLVHQGSKFTPVKRPQFFKWAADLEHVYYGLPSPDMVILLDIHPSWSRILREQGSRNRPGDIHENNDDHLTAAWESSHLAADHFRWEIIDCIRNEQLRSEQDIHSEILTRVNKRFKLF